MSDRILRPKDVCQLLGISLSSLWRYRKEGFPRPLAIGQRNIGWRESVVMEWVDKNNGGNDE